MADRPEVHLVAGLNGAGKTTFARRLEWSLPAVRFTLDEWMLRLHHLPYDDTTYPAAAAECRELIWDTARQVLRAGTPVVLDWNLFNRERRLEWAIRSAEAGYACVLHYLEVPLATAVARAEDRIDPAAHVLSRADVEYLGTLFEVPEDDEGFVIDRVDPNLDSRHQQ